MANHIIEFAVEEAKKKKRCSDYLFFGDSIKDIQCEPVHQFPGITTLLELFAVLERCWSKETAHSLCQADWVSDDPSYGQCEITASLVHDMFKGTIHRITVRGGISHYFNKIDGQFVDLTREQYDLYSLPENYEPNQEVSRAYLLKDSDTYQRYRVLQRNIIRYLNPEKNKLYEQTGFVPGKTLYIKVNGNWEKCVFLRFDIKNGNDVVYVEYHNKERFYAFPSGFVMEEAPRKNTIVTKNDFQIVSKTEVLKKKIDNLKADIEALTDEIYLMENERNRVSVEVGQTIAGLQREINDDNFELIKNDIAIKDDYARATLRAIDSSINAKYDELHRLNCQLYAAERELSDNRRTNHYWR